jgi:signal transduction histidine kinase
MALVAPEIFTPTPPPPSIGARCGVWILEDSPLEAEMARRALASRHGVEVFTEGSIVLERIANGQTPETLVLDWQLPGLSGLEVCRFLRSSRDEIALPILMVTCYGQKNDILEALAVGANDYLSKPYDVTELVARVGTLVRISRLHDAQNRRGQQLALAADVGGALTQGGDPGDVLKEVCAGIVRHLGVALSAIWMVEGDDLVLAAAAGPFSLRELPRRPSLKDHPLGHIARERARWINDVRREERLSGQAWAVDGVGTFMGYPLVVSENTLGLLVVLSPRAVLPDAIDALGSVADMIALGVEKARGERERAMLLSRERKAREDAETANRLKDEFLATVSHELRTPLHAISGWTGILQEGGITEERTARALQTIQRNAQAQTQLIDDLLDVSRIISGKVRLDVAPTDLLGVADLALETIRPVAAAKGVRLQSILDSGTGTVLGDAARLQQIIWNLVSNAVKFTPKGGEVKVNIHRTDTCVEITIEDNGQGISKDFLPQVFDRFRQADASIARTQGGLGLGLAIVRHLVELHGGTIEAFSPGPGLGSTFVVRIPFAPVGRRGEVTPSDRAPAAPLDFPPELVGLRILVVDDQPDARELLVMLLERCQANVTEAGSASEALELVRTTLPDVLVSDVGMPGEDGISLIRKVRALPKAEGGGTLAVALTAYARTEDRGEALVAGFDMHVAKPIQAGELLAVLSKVSRHQNA